MRAGIFQSAGGGKTPAERLNQLDLALKGSSLDIVVCPELFMSGYNVGSDLLKLAEPQQGPFSNQIAKLANTHDTAILYGYPERVGKELFNAAACIGINGELLAHHRKLLLPPGFEHEYFQPGNELTLFEYHGMTCAILICYDAEFPEAVRACAEAGAHLIIVPTALVDNWNSVAFQMMPTRAFENGVWLMYANHAGEENGASYLGASCIVAPDGSDVARAGAEQTLIINKLDLTQVARAQNRLTYLNDLIKLRRTLTTI